MESSISIIHCIRRQVCSAGLVIFERDDILLRHRPKFEDHTIGDIDAEFVAMLQDMRDLDVRFGFISHRTARPFDTRVRIDSATLTRLLDDLLKVSGAPPDFWIDAASTSDLEQDHRSQSCSELDLILKLNEWYETDLERTVIVRKAEAPRVSSDTLGLTEIFYPGLSVRAPTNISRPATVSWLKTMIKNALDLE